MKWNSMKQNGMKQNTTKQNMTKKNRKNAGFTMVEVLVSLAVTMMSMQICFQISGLYQMSMRDFQENRQMMMTAEMMRNQIPVEIPDTWRISETEEACGNLMQHTVQISGDTVDLQVTSLEVDDRGLWNS